MRLTKRILVFIGLKIMEIGGAAVVAVGLFWLGVWIERSFIGRNLPIESWVDYVGYIAISASCVIIGGVLLAGLAFFIAASWEKAGKIVGDK